ncbi:PREDICTED: cilia- and flagella-associated protein 47-like, partial [Priapulus caudatus]|uniref:Cilia- and flagella-associated protein 47-like n=1 Tax=Priapulus caudatus TaxID=37621 RepID=A0ABM1F7S9_PRICU
MNIEGTSVVLTLCVVFAPTRIFSHEVKLLVKSRAGAVWHFSLHLVATETSFDDVITMEAAGLARTSTVSFCLTSQTSAPAEFSATLQGKHHDVFSVSPSSGILLPIGSEGTQIELGFTPRTYGRNYEAKLTVETDSMQWFYKVVGMLPDYSAPHGESEYKRS